MFTDAYLQVVNIVYVIESAAYGVLFTSCLCQKPERARYERVRVFDTNNEVAQIALVAVRLGQFQQLLKTQVILILNFTRPHAITYTNPHFKYAFLSN